MKNKSFVLSLIGALAATMMYSPAYADKSSDTLNIAIDRELESIDNYYNTAREGIVISRMIWDGLLYRDPVTNEYIPNLATSYESWRCLGPLAAVRSREVPISYMT